MATYGIDYYDKAFYGAPILIDYAVTNLAAAQLDFGRIRISWTAPVQNVWTSLALVRSRYGFPVSISDGDLLASYSSTQASTSYDDYGLTPGYWYYAVFAAVPLEAWSAALTYQVGDRVAYSAQNWIAQQISTDVTPGAGAYWAPSTETAIWQGAGAVATMSVSDHGYAGLMDSYVPGSYQATPILTTDDQVVNEDLAGFLAVLGWGFEIMNTESDDLYHLYDTSTTRFDRLLAISQMLGISIEAASSPRYQRLRTAQAAQLGRAKGTQDGLAGLIEATTGLKCTVSTGPNLMLKRDQSDFPYPLYPAWQTDESYEVGDQITYQGERYVCIPWALAPALTGTPNTPTTGTFSSLPYTSEASTTAPSALTCSFQVPTTGVYLLEFTFLTGPAGGFVEVLMDAHVQTITPLAEIATLEISASGFQQFGTGSVTGTIDTYSASAAVGTTYVCPMNLTAGGSHNLTFLCTLKDSSSTGYGIEVSGAVLTAQWTQYAPNATAPASAGLDSGVQWAPPSAAAQPGYLNETTGQASTWSLVGSDASLIISYLGWIGLSMDTNWLTPVNGPFTASGLYMMVSAAYPLVGTYNGATAYTAGQIVTGPDGLQYTAQSATTANAPPDPGVWLRTSYGSPYDRELIAQSATPIHLPPIYDPHAAYLEGAQVQYGAGLYVAPAPTSGIAPPGSPGCNTGWEYVGAAAGRSWAASLYNPVPTTGTTTVYPGLEYYDQNGQPIVEAGLMNSATGAVAVLVPILARLIEPVGELNNVFADDGNTQLTASPLGYWQVSSGAANGNPAYTGTQKIKTLTLNIGTGDCSVGASFLTAVANHTVRDVGILFRWSDSTHFWAALRDQIVSYNAGIVTGMASYTRLPVGVRMYVQAVGTTIRLYAYPGASAAPTLITTVTSSFNQTGSYHGLIDWTW